MLCSDPGMWCLRRCAAATEGFVTKPFYGFVILGCCALGIVSASMGHSFMIGVWTDAIMRDLQLSRSAVSGIWTAALVSSSVYVNLIGRVVDRIGAPAVIRAAALPYGLAVASLAASRSSTTLTAAYLAVRMLGPETIDFACRNCVNMWWVRRRGMASGLLNALGAMMMGLPAVLVWLQTQLGWRPAVQLVAVVMSGLTLVSSVALVRRPEDAGLRPDGDCQSEDIREVKEASLDRYGIET